MYQFAFVLILLALLTPALQAETLSYQPQVTPKSYGYLPEDELRTIEVKGQPLQVLVRPWEGRNQYGTVTLLASPGQVPDTPGLIGYLRRSLNPDGWASINLSSPAPLPRASFSTSAEEISRAGEGQLTLDPSQATPGFSAQQFAEFLSERQAVVNESLSQLQPLDSEYPGKRIMVVSNQTAAMVIELLSQNKIPNPDLLVVFNPYLPQTQSNAGLVGALEQLTIPVLDIQSPDGHPASLETLSERTNLSRTKGPRMYRQLQMALNLDLPSAWQDASKAIKGFAYASLIR